MWKRFVGGPAVVVCELIDRPNIEKPSHIGWHQYVANRHIEDRIGREKIKEIEFITVMDGHGGPQAAEYLTHRLPKIFETHLSSSPSIREALRHAFHAADSEWFKLVHPVYDLGFTSPIKVGACALAIAIDQKEITVASVGDCKCVLAKKDGSVVDLNIERNINRKEEQERLRQLHPGEEDIVRCKRFDPIRQVHSGCYVKGRLQPTKSFGDFHLKSSLVIKDHERGNAFLDPEIKKSFPYIDVEPDITVTSRSGNEHFLIAATDGLWDEFSSENAVEIVRRALEGGMSVDQAAVILVEAALQNAATDRGISIQELKQLPKGSSRRSVHDDISMVLGLLEKLGQASYDLHQHLVVKQSGFLCCWSFNDYMTDGEAHAHKASRAFAHAAGIATNEDLKALASRAALHSSTAHQLSTIASKEM